MKGIGMTKANHWPAGIVLAVLFLIGCGSTMRGFRTDTSQVFAGLFEGVKAAPRFVKNPIAMGKDKYNACSKKADGLLGTYMTFSDVTDPDCVATLTAWVSVDQEGLFMKVKNLDRGDRFAMKYTDSLPGGQLGILSLSVTRNAKKKGALLFVRQTTDPLELPPPVEIPQADVRPLPTGESINPTKQKEIE